MKIFIWLTALLTCANLGMHLSLILAGEQHADVHSFGLPCAFILLIDIGAAVACVWISIRYTRKTEAQKNV